MFRAVADKLGLALIVALLLSCSMIICMEPGAHNMGPIEPIPPMESIEFEELPRRVQPPVGVLHKALKNRLDKVLSDISNNQNIDGNEQLLLIEDVYRIKTLLSLSNVNKQKCKTDYMSVFESVATQNLSHTFNISPYILHFARLQLSLCREFFHENLLEALERVEGVRKTNLQLLRSEAEAAGCMPTMGSIHQGFKMDQYNVAIGAASYMRKTMPTGKQRRFFIFKLNDFFDQQFDDLINLCSSFQGIMEPLTSQFDQFSDTDIERISTHDINWVSAARVCHNILFYSSARDIFQQAFNEESVARRG